MTRLKKLGIEEVDGNSDVSKLFASLAKLRGLEGLILRGFRFESMPCLDELRILGRVRLLKLDGCLPRLPSARNFPPSISYLKLVNTYLDEDPMPVLEKLRLIQLKLRNAYTGRQMVIHEDGFKSLKYLCIKELWNLRSLQVEEYSMQQLERLEIDNCPYLESLPEEIASMAYMEEFKMVTTKSIASKIRISSLINKIMVVDITP